MLQKQCADCGVLFQARREAAKFCSDVCRQRFKRRGGNHPSSPELPGRPAGPVEAALRADLAALMTAHPFGESIAAASVRLAQLLDYGGSLTGMAQANRALLDNVAELTRLAVDDADELADALSVPELPAGVRDATES